MQHVAVQLPSKQNRSDAEGRLAGAYAGSILDSRFGNTGQSIHIAEFLDSNSATVVLKIVAPKNLPVTRWPNQRRSGSLRYRLLAVVLLLACGGFLLAGDEKAAGPSAAPDKTPAHPYNYPFGASPFLPSQAKTASSGFIDPTAFPSASFCANCHQEAHRQWRQSAHANSFRAPFYKKNVDLLIAQKGIEFTRHCEGCHNPIALLSGALTKDSAADRSFDEDGITCMICHSIQKVQNTSGTGSYVMGTPAVMVTADGAPVTGAVSFDDILRRPELHGRAVMRDFYRTPEFCSVCHKAFLPAHAQ